MVCFASHRRRFPHPLISYESGCNKKKCGLINGNCMVKIEVRKMRMDALLARRLTIYMYMYMYVYVALPPRPGIMYVYRLTCTVPARPVIKKEEG